MAMTEPPAWFGQPPYGGGTGDPPFEPKYSASCFCKRVRFSVREDPVAAKISDCSTCMRLHGAPMQWAALFKKEAVRFLPESAAHLRFYNTATDTAYEDGAERQLPCKVQCKHCGTWVADEGRNMFMAFPTLFEFVVPGAGRPPQFPECFMPQSHIFCGTRALEMGDGLPRFLDDQQTPLTAGDFLAFVAPRLDGRSHKGQAGRIGVLGGSVDYAGAPYYAGISSLRVGSELLYLFTAEEATGPIKSYSPELMVSSVYNFQRISDKETREQEQDSFAQKVIQMLPRLHALCIGPGLGRHEAVLDAVARVINAARSRGLPLVIDADGLWLVTERPDLVKGCGSIVLTPNAMEFKRLAKAVIGDESASLETVCAALEGTIIVQKGAVDRIFAAGGQSQAGASAPLECKEEGAPRRPGGIGDLLCGTLTTVLAWAVLQRRSPLQACFASCALVRFACRRAYAKHKRALVAPDIIGELGPCFQELCPA